MTGCEQRHEEGAQSHYTPEQLSGHNTPENNPSACWLIQDRLFFKPNFTTSHWRENWVSKHVVLCNTSENKPKMNTGSFCSLQSLLTSFLGRSWVFVLQWGSWQDQGSSGPWTQEINSLLSAHPSKYSFLSWMALHTRRYESPMATLLRPLSPAPNSYITSAFHPSQHRLATRTSIYLAPLYSLNYSLNPWHYIQTPAPTA